MKSRRRSGKPSATSGSRRTANRPNAGFAFPRVVGEVPAIGGIYTKSAVSVFAERMRRRPTRAEREFNGFLLSLNDGVLRGQFRQQHVVSGEWIVDFFFPAIRLAVEIDGGAHLDAEQQVRDRKKEADCARFDITLVRFTNAEVFGNRQRLTNRLREAWRDALRRENRIIGKPATPGRPTDVS